MTDSNSNTGKYDVLTAQIGRFTETVTPLAVTVAHLTLTVEHSFAALKVVSREQAANCSQLIALAQSQPAARQQQQTVARLWARTGAQTAALPRFCSSLFGGTAGAQLASAFKTEGADQCWLP